MLPQEITALANRVLPLIAQSAKAQGTNYYSFKSANLKSEEWDALRKRLVEDGLATNPAWEVLKITSEGEQVVNKGPKGYILFLKKRNKEKNDTPLTNTFTRWGIGSTLFLSLAALFFSYKAYKKPDSDDKKIEELTRKQVILREELIKQLSLVTKRQDSLAHIVTEAAQLANPPSTAHASVLPPPAKRIPQGKTISR